jgi:hypothetical protein
VAVIDRLHDPIQHDQPVIAVLHMTAGDDAAVPAFRARQKRSASETK